LDDGPRSEYVSPRSEKPSSFSKRFQSVSKGREKDGTQETIPENDELSPGGADRMGITHCNSKQSINGWGNNASKENLHILDEDGNEYETLVELKNR
jgi:hypothetical protein